MSVVAKTGAVGVVTTLVSYVSQNIYHTRNKGLPIDVFDSNNAFKNSLILGGTVMFLRHPKTIIKYLGSVYSQAMSSQPAATGIATTGVSYSLGEFIAQKISISKGDRKEVDYRRLAIISLYGFALAGPIYFKFFSGIDHVPYLLWQVKNRLHAKEITRIAEFARTKGLQFTTQELAANPLTPVTKIASKIFVDQVLFSAPYTAFFLFTTSVMLGKTIEDAWKEVKSKFMHIYLYDCAFWPPGQLLNYGLIPSHLRQSVFSGLNLTWNTILCLLSAGH
jgi:hypothetical protein